MNFHRVSNREQLHVHVTDCLSLKLLPRCCATATYESTEARFRDVRREKRPTPGHVPRYYDSAVSRPPVYPFFARRIVHPALRVRVDWVSGRLTACKRFNMLKGDL